MLILYFSGSAFSEKILAWSYGPVVNEVYQKYKKNGKTEDKLMQAMFKSGFSHKLVLKAKEELESSFVSIPIV